MCGHGTVAAAHYLFEQGHKSPLKLYTPKAEVGADKVDGGVRIQLPHTTQFEPAPSDVLEVTNTIFNGGQVKPSDVKVAGVYLMVELESKVDLQALQIDTETLVSHLVIREMEQAVKLKPDRANQSLMRRTSGSSSWHRLQTTHLLPKFSPE